MKKKILFTILAAAIFCLMAISVSAVKIGDFEYSLDSATKEATFGNNKSYAGDTVYIPSTVEYEGVVYTVTSIGSGALYDNDNIVTLYIPNTVTKLIENTFACCDSLTSVYIDTDKLTYIGKCGMTYNNSDRDSKLGSNVISYFPTSEYGKENPQRTLDMKLENLTTLGAGALQGLNVNSLVLGGKLTTISKQLLRGSKFTMLTIKGEFTSIGEWIAPGCSNLQTVILESKSLKTVGASLFSGCTAISSFTIDLSQVTSVGDNAFRFSGDRHAVAPGTTQWYNVDGERIVDLSSLTTVGTQAFAGSNVGSAKIIWPTGITASNLGADNDSSTFRNAGISGTVYIDAADGYELNIDSWCFRNNEIETVIFGKNVTKVGAAFEGVTTLKTVIFLADSVDVTSSSLFKSCSNINFYFKSLTTNTSFSQANEIVITSGSYNDYGVCGFVTNLVTAEGDVTIGTASHTTSEAIDNALCPVGEVLVTSCKYCTYKYYSIDGEEVEAKKHDYNKIGSIVYANYFELGFRTNKCECGAEKAEETATEEAIFVDYGYSATEEAICGGYSVSQFFGVNQQALDAYVEITGRAFEYGIVVSLNTDPMNEANKDLIVQGKTYIATQSQIKHNHIDIKVIGLNSANLDKGLVFCMFVKDGENLFYLDNGKTVKTIEAKSYNEIASLNK